MVRRWSHVTSIENDFCASIYYKKRFKFRIFRLNVRFRRFNLKKTKFKRKALIRLKHRTNFSLFFNVIRHWINDCKFTRSYYKYQFSINILPSSALVYDPNFFRPMSEFFLYNFDGHLTNFSNFLFRKFNSCTFAYSKKMNITFATYFNNFDYSSAISPVASLYDRNLFDITIEENAASLPEKSVIIEFKNNFFLNLFLLNVVELKSVLNYLFFIILTTLKNLFLKLINFRKKIARSNGSRNLNFFFIKLNLQPKFKFLSFLKKNKSGRGASGRIIIRTKTSVLIKRREIKINYVLNYKKLNLTAGFVFLPFKNKLLSLFFFSNGSASYFLSTQNHKIFHYSTFLFHKKYRKFNIKRVFAFMFRIKKLSFLSYLSITPLAKAQYVRSPGCKSRLFKFDKEKHNVTMELPSGAKKLFSYYSIAFLSPISNFNHKNSTNGKAGYWRSFGVKSIVRGVAKNPVDHPHGGRTKAIKHQRTPWGKTTKYK